MRVLKLHHPTGHPYWNQGEFILELPDDSMLNPVTLLKDNYGGSYDVYVKNGDVMLQQCACGSGYGKVRMTEIDPIVLIKQDEYDQLEYVGEPLEINQLWLQPRLGSAFLLI